MKLKLILTTAIVGTALALPSVSNAAPPAPTLQDSVVLTGAPADTTLQSPEGTIPLFGHVIWELHATSGPNGENPSGLVRFSNGPANFGGPVTCLNVSGDTATITFVSDPSIISFPPINAGVENDAVTVTDGQPDTFAPTAQSNMPIECPPPPPDPSRLEPLSNGNITVVDAPPTTRDQCLNGWEQFGFKNQGQCIAFVNHGP
jgi:hypothetical protein